MEKFRDGKGFNKNLWEGTGSRMARTKDGIPTVRKLGAADVAVLDDLPGEKQQRGKQLAMFCLSLQGLQV
jgi:hypothetical protein